MAKRRENSPATERAEARRARQQRRRESAREEILAAARKVLLSGGVVAMTLDAVAREAGMSKTGLYYYYPSKDALLFELVYAVMEEHAKAVHDAVGTAENGGEALRAIIAKTVGGLAPKIDDFRLAFLLGQVAGAESVRWGAEQIARIRPLNDLVFAGAARLLREESKARGGRPRIEPRLLAFLAHVSAIGLLTMKGLVEQLDSPLVYSDAELVEGLSRVFEAAARE